VHSKSAKTQKNPTGKFHPTVLPRGGGAQRDLRVKSKRGTKGKKKRETYNRSHKRKEKRPGCCVSLEWGKREVKEKTRDQGFKFGGHFVINHMPLGNQVKGGI